MAVHHLDVGWRPADMTQRNGRIIRQGNRNKQVQIFQYVTEGTFDAYLYQTLENKQKFISQIMTYKSPVRSCEDVDEAALSYAEIKALCAGEPRIKERMELDVDVSRLKVMKAAHQSKQYELEDNLMKHFPEQIRQYQGYIEGLEADMRTLAEHPHVGTSSISLTPPQAAEFVHSAVLPLPTKPKDGFAGAPAIKEIPAPAPAAERQCEGAEPVESAAPAAVAKEVSQGFAGMVIKGTAYEDKEAAGAALVEACKEVKDAEPVMIGSYRGFIMSVSVSLFKHKLALKGEMTHETDLGTDVRGNLMRIDHALEKMPDRLTAIKAQLEYRRRAWEPGANHCQVCPSLGAGWSETARPAGAGERSAQTCQSGAVRGKVRRGYPRLTSLSAFASAPPFSGASRLSREASPLPGLSTVHFCWGYF